MKHLLFAAIVLSLALVSGQVMANDVTSLEKTIQSSTERGWVGNALVENAGAPSSRGYFGPAADNDIAHVIESSKESGAPAVYFDRPSAPDARPYFGTAANDGGSTWDMENTLESSTERGTLF